MKNEFIVPREVIRRKSKQLACGFFLTSMIPSYHDEDIRE
jgi:hypothetical protein